MKSIFFLLLVTMSVSAFAQKPDYDKKTGTVSLEGEPIFKLTREGSGDYFFEVKDSEDKTLIICTYKYGREYTKGWSEIVFLETKQKLTISDDTYGASRKAFAKYIVKNNLIKDGKLNTEAVERFMLTKEITPPVQVEMN